MRSAKTLKTLTADDDNSLSQIQDEDVEYFSDGGDDDVSSTSSDSMAPQAKSKNFEFTNNLSVMRLVRMFLCMEAIGIIIDTPSFFLPSLFKICCRPVLYYVIRFYSYPIIDLAYLVQYYLSLLKESIQRHLVDQAKGGVEVHAVRRLTTNTYLDPVKRTTSLQMEVDFVNQHNWHTISHFTHYVLGILFAGLFVAFTLKMWQILDWTDRNEVRTWLSRYIADGWWRKGGLMVAVNTLIAICMLTSVYYFIYAAAREFNVNSIPEARIVGGAVVTAICTVFTVWLIGYCGIRSTEVAFIRYVSQNVSYTSVMVLKKAVKAKVEVGLSLMLMVFAPVMYNLTQSLMIINDWNDNWATPWRKNNNYFTSCYFFAFPPYVRDDSEGSCFLTDTLAADAPQRQNQLFSVFHILQCDSFLGIYVYVASTLAFAFVLCGYGYLFHVLVTDTIREIKASKWVNALLALQSLRKVELAAYNAKFSLRQRIQFGIVQELYWQYKQMKATVMSVVPLVKALVVMLFHIVWFPLKCVLEPINFIFDRCFALGCDGLTLEGRRRKFQAMQLQKLDHNRTYRNRRFTIGQVYDYQREQERLREAEAEFRTYSDIFIEKVTLACKSCARRMSGVGAWYNLSRKRILQSELVASSRANAHFMMNSIRHAVYKEKHKIRSHHSHAPWRIANKVNNRTRMLQEIDRHMAHEVDRIKHEFVTDHALTITVLDTTMDTAGMTFLVCPFTWNKLWWMMIVLLEMGCYAVFGALLNFYCSWDWKLRILLVVNLVFGVITFLSFPYSSMVDRSLDFFGRVLVSGTCIGIIIVRSTMPESLLEHPETIPLYKPWITLKMIAEVNPFSAGLYFLVDAVMVIYFYWYIVYILHLVGFFRTAQRKINSVIYTFHDHILDLLVEKLDERTVGLENVMSGLRLVQQWDDIVDEQRRYAFWTWPDVRPYWLLTAPQKCFDVKWASLFNLTIGNLRSSLGLTLLHTAMCAGDSESTRWILHRYPELLYVGDMQRDTPIAIGLKECSFFVLKYAEQNGGSLVDGSSLSDDIFDDYYPEIEEFRDLNAELGEYFPAEADVYTLRSIEVEQLVRFGHFKEIRGTVQDKMPSFYERKMKERQLALEQEALEQGLDTNSVSGLKSLCSLDSSSVNVQKEQARIIAARKNAKMERLRLASARFPEDNCENDLASGQMDSWKIIGIEVPESNLFIDENEDSNPMLSEDFDEDLGLDLKVHIETATKRVLHVRDVAEVPEDHPERDQFADWHTIANTSRARSRSQMSIMSDNRQASMELAAAGVLGEAGATLLATSRLNSSLDREARFRDIRWRLCKYAELFLSGELGQNCREMEWDVNLYKEWNKLASSIQGRIAQNLAMVCNFNPPEGFARISEWTQGVAESEYDEPEYAQSNVGFVEKGVLSVVGAYQQATSAITGVARNVARTVSTPLKNRRGGHHPPTASVTTDAAHGAFNDRVIHFLAECMVCSRQRLNLEDCELSVYGRFGWRAIIRALRRKYCSFILPSSFISARKVWITHLELGKNELDCGDAVLVADALLYQQTLKYLDLSFNRIGSRGTRRLCQTLKSHESIVTVKLEHNRIGPAAGKELGELMKQSRTLRILNLSHNRMGALVKYSQMFVRERIPSAAKALVAGLRLNKYLQIFDVSYNHLGPDLCSGLPGALARHPSLVSLNIAGNDIGPDKGAAMLFAMAGKPGGEKVMQERISYYANIRVREMLGEDPQRDIRQQLKDVSQTLSQKTGVKKNPNRRKAMTMIKPTKQLVQIVAKTTEMMKLHRKGRPCQLAELQLADNQLGWMCGHGVAALIAANKSLTALDLSSNALGPTGGIAISAVLERIYGIPARDLHTEAMHQAEMEELKRKNELRKKSKQLITNLTALNISRNALSSNVVGGLMLCLSSKQCTLTDLNISDNPLGLTGSSVTKSEALSQQLRQGLGVCQTLQVLDLSRSLFIPTQLVTMLGGLAGNQILRELSLENVHLDEPCCLQLAHVIFQSHSIAKLNLRGCKMGPQGSYLVLRRIGTVGPRFTSLDLTANKLGPRAALCIGKFLREPGCAIEKLLLSDNDLSEAGGSAIANALLSNMSIREIDLSHNGLTPHVGSVLATVAKGTFKHGRLVSHCKIVNINVSHNHFGVRIGKELVHAMVLGKFRRVEMANIGVGPSSAEVIGKALRDVCTTWRYCDVSGNNFGRAGMNRICWSLRVNRSVRVFICRDCKAGPVFGTEEDALLKHGVSVPRMLRTNVVIRELDLSFNALSPAAGTLLFEAMLDNYSIRRLCVRGNLLDDEISPALGDFVRYNNVVEDLDLGDNRLGYDCCFVLAHGLEVNHSIKYLTADNNRLGNASLASIEALSKALMVNHTLRHLNLDGNKLGPHAGEKFSETLVRNNTITKLSLRDNRLDAGKRHC
jgi:Ran GTPase-activating protein (RanGAP) involved in mRNA processing and transport